MRTESRPLTEEAIKRMRRENEINTVKNLGESIGYGNLMDIASALWAMQLSKTTQSKAGAFIPVSVDDIKINKQTEYLEKQDARINEIKY